MKSKPIAKVVDEYFRENPLRKASINDVLKYYVEKYGENNSHEMKKARHAIYLKIYRLVKTGKLVVSSKQGKSTYYTQAINSDKTKMQKNAQKYAAKSEQEILHMRKAELEYELELCIAEAQGYEEMKSLLPTQIELLSSKKNEAKKRAIRLNGLLTSTQSVLHVLQ